MVTLGDEEGLHREFKRAAALKTPDIIARGVVAFLNEDGGSLCVGIAEDGQGRAKAYEPIPDVDAERQRLQNVLIDTIEPPPTVDDDVTISVLSRHGTEGLLLVKVKEGGGSRPPYALLDKGRRGYFKRTGSRIRTMTREELAESFAKVPEDRSKRHAVIQQVDKKLTGWIGASPAGLRMLVKPIEPIPLRLAKAELHSLLVDPEKTGNRELGWTFINPRAELRAMHPNKAWRFGKRSDVQWLELSEETGELEFFVSRDRLHWHGNPNELWPFALLELPVSVLRLAKVLYSAHTKSTGNGEIVLALGIDGIGDCTLRPHSPDSVGYVVPRLDLVPLVNLADRDFFSGTPSVVSRQEVIDAPDRCAVQLVAQLYRDFGYDEEQLPREYNRDTGRLVFAR